MLTRQKILLKLLVNSEGHSTRLKLFKLAFLLSMEGTSEGLRTFYQFLPYLYGPYSFTLNYELNQLVNIGAISFPDKDRIELTAIGNKIATEKQKASLLQDLESLQAEYGVLNQKALLNIVYEKFPWFTFKSTQSNKIKTKKIRLIVPTTLLAIRVFKLMDY